MHQIKNSSRRSVQEFVSVRAKKEARLGIDLRRNYRKLAKEIESAYLDFGSLAIDGVIERNRQEVQAILEEFYAKTIGDLALMQQNKLLKKKELTSERFIDNAQDFIISQGLSKSITIAETSKNITNQFIARSISEGESSDKVARGLRTLVGRDLAAFKSVQIARTEIGNAASFAQDQGARESGLLLQKEWVAVTDEATRDDHIEVDGDVVGMEQSFMVGGFPMLHPNDTAAPAGQVINCRCVVNYIPVL